MGRILAERGPADFCADCPGPFASKPAPTFDRCHPQILCSPKIPCGSELARESYRPLTPASRPGTKGALMKNHLPLLTLPPPYRTA
ncbi:hypothetical protein C3E98_025840 [Pseudomonas sp. MWU13-2625]|nr:hypothetical protein C3E98_025840 [Pseudomonas sp. MWU13-2625]